MLHHGCQGNGDDGNDGAHDKAPVGILEHMESRILPAERHTHPGGFLHGGKVAQAKTGRHDVRAQHTQEDGDNLNHAFAPDVANNDNHNGQQGNPPVAVAVLDGAAAQRKTNRDDDGSRDDGREEAHHLLGAECRDEPGQHKIKNACRENSDAGIRKGFRGSESLLGSQGDNGCVATEESEGRTQEGRHPHFGEKVKN